MPVNIIGPHGPGVGETTTRPTDTASGAGSDSWFRDCVSGQPGTGTKIPAVWLNKVAAQLRRAIRGMGIAETETDDDMLLKAIQKADRTIENVGSGVSVYKGLNVDTGRHQLRSIKAGSGITVAANEAGTEVLIAAGTAEEGGGDFALYDFVAEYEVAQNTWGGTSATTYTDRPLNTIIYDRNSWGLASNRVPLPAGTYVAEWMTVSNNVFTVKTRLYNHTAGTVLRHGSAGLVNRAASHNTEYTGFARFTLAAPSSIAIQQISQYAESYGHGYVVNGSLPSGAGPEIYARIKIKKVLA